MKSGVVDKEYVLMFLVFVSAFVLLVLTGSVLSGRSTVSDVSYDEVGSNIDVNSVKVNDDFNVDIKGVKSVFIPGEEKPLTISVQNNGKRTVNKCQIMSSGSGYVESDLITNINSGEIIDFPVVIGVVDEFPKIWLECVEGKKDIDINFVLYTLDVSAEILNVNFEGNNLVINYRISTDVDFDDSIIVRVSDNSGKVIKSVEKTIRSSKGESVDDKIYVELNSEDEGLINVAILHGSAVLIEDTVIYGQNKVDVTGYSIWKLFSGGTYTYIFVMVLFFLFISSFIVIKIYHNICDNYCSSSKFRKKRKA